MPNGSATVHSAETALDSLTAVDVTMHRLLISTLRHERLVAERDCEVAAVQKQRNPSIEKAAAEIALFESQIQQYYLANRQDLEQGKKSIQLSNGLMGMRSPTRPALVPFSDRWTWEKIEAKVRELWKSKYFHKPKPPAVDKEKLKKWLDKDQLKECGLKLDTTETFYLELNRLAMPDEAIEKAA
jgi:hypothetical protein